MNDDLNLLVTVLQRHNEVARLLRCAIRIPHGRNRFNTEYLLQYAPQIHALLPLHVANVGPICAIEELFDICEAKL